MVVLSGFLRSQCQKDETARLGRAAQRPCRGSVWGGSHSLPGRPKAAWRRPPRPGAGDLLRTSGWERLETGGAPPLRHSFFPRPGAVALLPRSEQVTTSPSGEARGPGGSVCWREGSPASPGRSTGCSPLEGAPRRSPPPRWAPSCSRTWRPPGLGVSWETRSLDLSHVTISQKQLDSNILSVVCREFAEPLSIRDAASGLLQTLVVVVEGVSGAAAGILAALSSCPLLPVSEDPAKASCVPRGELALALGATRDRPRVLRRFSALCHLGRGGGESLVLHRREG